MKTLKTLGLAASLLATVGIAAMAPTPAMAQGGESPAMSQGGFYTGTLTCNVASGWGFVFGSTRAVNCTFSGPGGYEHYTGAISQFGLDIGYIPGGAVVWSVFAPTAGPAPGLLAGPYALGPLSAAPGIALGANVLIGGYGNAVALQPIRFEGGVGLNVAAGITGMTLTAGG